MRDRVLSFVRVNGPVLPNSVSKNLKMDSIITGAFLSSLVSSKQIRVTDLKVGSSPLYYAPGQEPKLQDFSSNLNEKDFRTYVMLKEHKVLQDSECDALTRVSLGMIKDFAIPLNVTYQDQVLKFWKWYMLSDDQASELIKELLGLNYKQAEEQSAEPAGEVDQPVEQAVEQTADQIVEEKIEEPVEPQTADAQVESQAEVQILKDQIEKQEESSRKRIEELERLVKTIITNQEKTIEEQPTKSNEQSEAVLSDTQIPKHLKHLKPLLSQQNIKLQTDDQLYIDLNKFLSENACSISNFKIIRKGKEGDFIMHQNNFFGKKSYFVKFKTKKQVSDKDLESTLEAGSHLGLTPILISTGDLNKKGSSFMASNEGKIFFSQLK